MAVYQAPEIKDRIAVGDDLYEITDSDGKKKLTPSPTEITEAGTAVNKALLQPMADAIGRIDTDFIPYTQYWWRRRPAASSYTETRQAAVGQGYSHTSGGVTYYFLDGVRYDSGEYTCATLQYASSVSINQSTGAVSLVNPSSYTFTEDTDVSSSSVYGRFQGKYVKGFLGATAKIFYIPAAAYMDSYAWEVDGNSVYEKGFRFAADSGSYYLPLLVGSVKNTAVGDWEAISSDSADTYATSGTSGGYDWAYLGKISDAVLTPDVSWTTVNVTSASFSNYICDIEIPAEMALVALSGGTSASYRYGHAFGVVDTKNKKFYGWAIGGCSSSSGYYPTAVCGSETISRLFLDGSATCDATVQAGGIRLTNSANFSISGAVCYMPLDK